MPVTDLQIAVGEKPGSYGGIVGMEETYNAKILFDWEEAFLINQTS